MYEFEELSNYNIQVFEEEEKLTKLKPRTHLLVEGKADLAAHSQDQVKAIAKTIGTDLLQKY